MRRAFRLLTIAALFAVALPGAWTPARAANAATDVDTMKAGPPVGAKLPDDLSALDQNGQHQDFKALAHKRGLVILFSRSVDW